VIEGVAAAEGYSSALSWLPMVVPMVTVSDCHQALSLRTSVERKTRNEYFISEQTESMCM